MYNYYHENDLKKKYNKICEFDPKKPEITTQFKRKTAFYGWLTSKTKTIFQTISHFPICFCQFYRIKFQKKHH